MRAPVDPEVLPHDPDFPAQRGPALAPARLQAAALRERFARTEDWQTEQDSDGRLFLPHRDVRPAAVLIGLLPQPEGLHVVFTVRSAHLNDHAGQISFPGGRVEVTDATHVAAALREAHEEVALAPAQIEVLGTLPPYLTVSGYAVTPVVGLIAADARLAADPLEVQETFSVPLAYLMDSANHQRRIVVTEPRPRGLYAIEYWGARRYLIWGATAAMLRNFYRFLRA